MELSALTALPAFRGVSEADLATLLYAEPSYLKVVRPGTLLFRQGDSCEHLHLLTEGRVRATMRAEGKELTVEELTAPALLASAFLFTAEHRFPVTAKALTEVELFSIPRRAFVDFMVSRRAMIEGFLADVSERNVFLAGRLRAFALQSLKTRILDYLTYKGEITNQEEVAKILGVARPSLSRALSELMAEGKIPKR